MNFRSDEVYLVLGKSKSGKTELASYFARNFKSVVIYETLLKKNYMNIHGIKSTANPKDISLFQKQGEKGKAPLPFYMKIKFYLRDHLTLLDPVITELFKRRDTFFILEESQMLFRIGKNPSQVQTAMLRAGAHDWAIGQCYLTQKISDLNKIVLTQMNHCFFFQTWLKNDIDYICENFGEQCRDILPRLRHVENDNPADHEFLYVRDSIPRFIGYLDGNQIKIVRSIEQEVNPTTANEEKEMKQENENQIEVNETKDSEMRGVQAQTV